MGPRATRQGVTTSCDPHPDPCGLVLEGAKCLGTTPPVVAPRAGSPVVSGQDPRPSGGAACGAGTSMDRRSSAHSRSRRGTPARSCNTPDTGSDTSRVSGLVASPAQVVAEVNRFLRRKGGLLIDRALETEGVRSTAQAGACGNPDGVGLRTCRSSSSSRQRLPDRPLRVRTRRSVEPS